MKKLLNRKKIAVLLGLLLVAWNLPVYAEDTGAEANPPESSSVETTLPEQPEETEIPDSDIPETPGPKEEETPDKTDPSTEGDTPANPEEEQEPGRFLKAAQEINVSVPAYGQMIINPYSLLVESEGIKTTEQIINPVQELTNTGSQPVLVDVRVVGSVPEGSEAVLVDREPAPDVKEVFLYAEFQNNPAAWLDGYKAGYNQVPAVPEGANGEGVLTLEAEETGYFRIFGEMSTEPFWKKTDTFDVSLAFSFMVIGEEPTKEEPKDEPIPDSPDTPGYEDLSPGDTPTETPEEPANPEQPDTLAEPENPGEPTEPIEPENPENPGIPELPELPVTPEEPAEPTVPETPAETETPQEPEQPEESPDPDTPSEEPVEPGPTENTDVQEPPVTPEQA